MDRDCGGARITEIVRCPKGNEVMYDELYTRNCASSREKWKKKKKLQIGLDRYSGKIAM